VHASVACLLLPPLSCCWPVERRRNERLFVPTATVRVCCAVSPEVGIQHALLPFALLRPGTGRDQCGRGSRDPGTHRAPRRVEGVSRPRPPCAFRLSATKWIAVVANSRLIRHSDKGPRYVPLAAIALLRGARCPFRARPVRQAACAVWQGSSHVRSASAVGADARRPGSGAALVSHRCPSEVPGLAGAVRRRVRCIVGRSATDCGI
jgi:hypothetical protein